jgi:hypothetical protein
MMTHDDSYLVRCRICEAIDGLQFETNQLILELKRPSAIYKPRIAWNGNCWWAVYGEDSEGNYGVVGKGATPSEAMADFDKVWEGKE